MTLPKFIKDREGQLVNTDHIVQIVAEEYPQPEGFRKLVVIAHLDSPSYYGDLNGICTKNQHELFYEHDCTLVEDYDEELSKEHWSRLWGVIARNLDKISDYQSLEIDFSCWFDEHIDAIKEHKVLPYEL